MSGSPPGVEEEKRVQPPVGEEPKERGREATKSLLTTCCHWDVGERSSSSSTLLVSIRMKSLQRRRVHQQPPTGAQPRASLGILNRTSDTSGRSWVLAVNLVLDKLIIPPAYGVAQDVSQRARLTSRLDRHARLKSDRVTAGLLHEFTSCSLTFFLVDVNGDEYNYDSNDDHDTDEDSVLITSTYVYVLVVMTDPPFHVVFASERARPTPALGIASSASRDIEVGPQAARLGSGKSEMADDAPSPPLPFPRTASKGQPAFSCHSLGLPVVQALPYTPTILTSQHPKFNSIYQAGNAIYRVPDPPTQAVGTQWQTTECDSPQATIKTQDPPFHPAEVGRLSLLSHRLDGLYAAQL
ncbi:hypothetical protein CDEST_11907 [Colletotrichum destructivum]|uniref:Uncharacterized protein n=1 Tax=Colletotrichum destructivum TaxID=34406 RepID=A0AAX4IUH2_9PEZI|nr:hypothetical protein CDEST_11907 [Colletotrichum destructivum]